MVTPRWGEDGFAPGPPIPVDGGLRARSKRGSIGERWWSRRFIDVLESLGMTGRMQRGRRYARTGQVMDLRLAAGQVSATVQGSRPAPYQVRIRVLPLTTAQWQRVEAALAGQALFRARLLAGEMPAEIEDIFAGCGTPLFPRSARDLEMRCSCPDWEIPCKHLAAVCYLLAEQFDADPFRILQLRGRDREQLLAALRQPGDLAGPADPRPVLDVTARPLAECLDDFWGCGLSQARLRALPATPVTAPGLLLRVFEPPPVVVRGRDLATVLRPAYQRLADVARPGDGGRPDPGLADRDGGPADEGGPPEEGQPPGEPRPAGEGRPLPGLAEAASRQAARPPADGVQTADSARPADDGQAGNDARAGGRPEPG